MAALSEPASPGAQGDDLFLDLSLNGNPKGLTRFGWHDGELWAGVSTLRALGFVLPEGVSDPVRLASLPGVNARYDAGRQSLEITAAPGALHQAATVVDTAPTRRVAANASPGMLLNYDLYATQGRGGSTGLNALAELRAFSGNSVLSHTMMSQALRERGGGFGAGVGAYAGDDRWKHNSVRLDTTWSKSWPDEMLTLRVGDAITGSLPWSRAMRIGGIQLSRNFSLQPYRVTTPLPAFMGSAALPSQVELYINGVRQYTGELPSGPFQLNTVPSISGAGQAQVVLTDAFGRATTLDFSLYDSQRLLQQGLSDWSVELGWVRQNYGLRSFDYGRDLMASGVWRHGVTNRLTLEAHGEATRGLAKAGVGGAWLLGMGGVLSGAVARSSSHDGASGSLLNLGYSWQNEGFSLSVEGTRSTSGYRDLASLNGSLRTRGSGRASIGYSAGALGNFGLSYLYLRQEGASDPLSLARQQAAQAVQAMQPTQAGRWTGGDEAGTTRLASLYWSRSIGRSMSMSVSLNQNLDKRRERSLYVGFSWALDGNVNVNAGVQRERDATVYTADAQRAAPSEGGVGWRAGLRQGGGQRGGQAELNYLGRYGRATAGVSVLGDSRYLYAGAMGSVVLMDGHAFASRRIDSGFALVSTDGLAGVPVQLENREVGRTDRHGVLLVTPLQAYQANRLSIDPMNLPANMRIDRVRAEAAPTDRAGTRVRFAIQPVRAASLILVDETGAPLPLGSTVQLLGQPGVSTLVGYDGAAYLDALDAHNVLDVQTPRGACQARFDYPGDEGGIPQIGPLRCVPATKDKS